MASGVTGILLFAACGLGTFYVDKVGRRTMIIGGGICVATTQLSIAAEGMRITATTKPRMKSLSVPKCAMN